MAIYDFKIMPMKVIQSGIGSIPEVAPSPNGMPSSINELHSRTNRDLSNTNPVQQIHELIIPAFKDQDRGVLNFFSGMVVPGKDVVRPVSAIIAGGDKSYLQWQQELRHGRIKLPAVSIKRNGANWNPQKYSPAYVPVNKVFSSPDGTHVRMAYRPRPYIIDYTLSIWGEHKEDVEIVLYQVLSKFAPLAQFTIDTGRVTGEVILKIADGYTDASDIEIGPEDMQKYRYEVNFNAEGWIEIPQHISPVILGKVSALYDYNGEYLGAVDINKTVDLDLPPIEE